MPIYMLWKSLSMEKSAFLKILLFKSLIDMIKIELCSKFEINPLLGN